MRGRTPPGDRVLRTLYVKKGFALSRKKYLAPAMPEEEVNKLSVLGLAHIGDAVYELLVRSWLCVHGRVTSRGLHSETVRLVRAPAQAAAAEKLLPRLTERESAVYRRGRNTRVNSVPRHAAVAQYHAATGLEALFGWLWLLGERERVEELFGIIMEEDDAS